MKKTYQMLLVLALVMLGATNAVGQKIYRAELDKSMFKAWDGCGVDAQEVADPQPIDVTEEKPEGTKFSCDFNLYKEIGSWSGIYGSTAAYYLWYADLTGTKKMYFTGTPGFKFYVQFNREAPTEGGDSHGGNMVQQELTIAEDGTATYDIPETMTYVHLNCIKTKQIDGTGVLKGIEIEGTVKPVTGILSMINNGDAEGDDLTSFPVSYDGPNNGDTANDKPEIVEGVGVNGSKCFKVTSFPNPTETWHTQFYIKSDEVLPKGTKWKLTMSIKADHESKITTSAQGQPRQHKGGFIDGFTVTDEWQEFTWTGEIGVDDFQSIAFDLNNGAEGAGNGGCAFFFDNIEFGVDLGGANPMNNVTPGRGNNVIRVDFAGLTNMKNLVEANGITAEFPDESGENMVKTKTLVFDNNCFDITWNGKKPTITSVEGRTDGNLYIFLADTDGNGTDEFGDEDAVVKIAFKNPADEKHHLTFISGKWEGDDVPDFSGIDCPYQESMTTVTYYSYLLAAPEMVSVEPENGSFNLPADLKEIEVTFTQPVDVTTVVATLGGEALTVAPAEGFADIVTLTRTGDAALAGVKLLVIADGVKNAQGSPTTEDITVKYSFGESQISEDDQPEVIYQSVFNDDGSADALGAGWIVNADAGGMQAANSSGGCRLMHNQGAFLDDLLYIAQRGTPNVPGGIALYGTETGHNLTLEAGKNYKLTLGACMHDTKDVALLAQVLPFDAVDASNGSVTDETQIVIQERKDITPEKASKEAVRFDLDFTVPADGNYVLRFLSTKSDGSAGGYGGCVVFGDVKVEYIPDVMGLLEMKAMATALENAKSTREQNSDERYAGAAYTALDNLITEYDGKVMTSPTAYTEGANKLNEAATALSDHRKSCDTYDALPKQAQDLVIANANKKFAVMDEYTTLKTIAAKYIESEEVVEGETVYTFKVLTDDAELAAAIAELQDITKLAKSTFTEGASKMNTTGVAALIERLRLGAEGLKALGVKDDPLIVAANEALEDDDALAEQIKTRTKTELYTKLKDGENIFVTTKMEEVANPDYNTEDPEGMAAAEIPATIEQPVDVPVTYDMSVFVKNPNMYSPANSTEVPGWEKISGNNVVGWSAWDETLNHSKIIPPYAEDCALHPGWHAVATVEQTITDLPVGVYTINARAYNNGSLITEKTEDVEDKDVSTPNYVYVKLSDTPAVAEGQDLDFDTNFAAYSTFNTGSDSHEMADVVVADGVLTIGCTWGSLAQAFFDWVKLTMTAPVNGFNYADAIPTAIETLEGTPAVKVRAIEMFDLNGRRVTKATKGLVIMKQIMSDGTVRTRKVVK